MKIRPWILGAFVIVGIGLDAYLLAVEPIAQPEAGVVHVVERADSLVDMTFTAANRESNLKRFGLAAADLTDALARVNELGSDVDNRARIVRFIEEVGDPTRLAEAMCASGTTPSRYAAMPWLVTNEKGSRYAVSISRLSSFQVQAWSVVSPISDVYTELELSGDRQPEATLLGLAAILLAKEAEVLDRRSAWHRWSWVKVKEKYPGIEDRLFDYLAVMHVTLEIANEDGGFCGKG